MIVRLLVALRDWVDARLPIVRAWNTHMGKYYAPKNFNFFYFFVSRNYTTMNWGATRDKNIAKPQSLRLMIKILNILLKQRRNNLHSFNLIIGMCQQNRSNAHGRNSRSINKTPGKIY